MDFNQFLNEAKNFKVGDTWEWHGKDWDPAKKANVDTVKKVKITDIKGSEITGQFDGESKEYIIRDASKYLKKKVNESADLNEAFEVHYSDGVRAMKKFNNQSQAISFAKDLIKNKKGLQFVDVFNAGPGFHSTSDTDAIVAFWGNGSYTDNVSKKDAKLAAKKIEESVEVNEAAASYGLTKAETKKVAETLAKAISKNDGVKCTVNLKSLEEDSFDLDIDGEEYDGGSYYINDKGEVINAAVTPHEIYGKAESSVEDFIKGLKKPVKESVEVNEGAVKQFEKDMASMINDIKRGFGWIDPEYVEETWENSSDTIDFELVKNEIYKRLIAAGLLAYPSDEDEEEAGKYVKSLKELGIKESAEINESRITIKRQYTESYPAKTVGKHAAIRNKVIEALKDGQLTKEEFEQIVSGLTEDSKRWLRRNATFFNIQEDQVSLSSTGRKILNSFTNNTVKKTNENMDKFIYESFSEFVENRLNENEVILEALKSSILAGFIDLRFAPKELFKAFYNYTKVDLNAIEDEDFIQMAPSEAYKSKTLGNSIVFYVSQNEKANPYAPEDGYSNKTIPAGSLLAIANGQNEFFGIEWSGRWSSKDQQRLFKNKGKDANRVDTTGISKDYRGWNATGLSNVKRIAEVSDVAYVLPMDVIRNKYSTEALRQQRELAKQGATALMDAKKIKDENNARYKNILATRMVNDDVDAKVEKGILTCNELIQKAVKAKEQTKYGEIKVGNDPKGRDVKLTDVTSFMNQLISDYERYVRYLNDAELATQRGDRDSYYKAEAKNYALSIKQRLAKLDNLNIAW